MMPASLAGQRLHDPDPQISAGAPSGVFDTLMASGRVARDDATMVQNGRIAERYDEVVQALDDMGYETGRYLPDSWMDMGLVSGTLYPIRNYDRVWGDVVDARGKNGKAFANLPKTKAEFDKAITTRDGARGRDQAVAARGNIVAQFVGGAAGSMTDPANAVASLTPAGKGVGLLSTVIRNGAINMAIEGLQQSDLAQTRELMGEKLTLTESAERVLGAGVGGGALAGLGYGLGKAFPPAREAVLAQLYPRMPEKIRARISDPTHIPNTVLADLIDDLNPNGQTPDLRELVQGLRRDGQVAEDNPFYPDGAGIAAHAERMAAAMKAALAGVPSRVEPSTALGSGTVARRGGGVLPADVVNFFRDKGYSEAQSRGIAAGVMAESRGDHRITGPAVDAQGRPMQNRAHGLGQWVSADRRANFKKQFGIDITQSTRRQQLEFLHWELQGGDAGGRKVLAQTDEADVLRSYIEDFMRPAKGAETSGDLRRGMAALGREGEAIATRADADSARADVDGIAAERAALAEGARLSPEQRLAERADVADDSGMARPVMDLADDLPEAQAVLMPRIIAAVADPARPSIRPDRLAEQLGAPEADVRQALDYLAERRQGVGRIGGDPVRATVAQDAAPDEGLGPASMLSFLPARGEPGVSVRVEDGALATAVYRDADGIAQGAVQYPITAEMRDMMPEVSSFVQPAYRRQGIATQLYDALEAEGYGVDALSGTGDLTPAGAAFVNARRGAGFRRSPVAAAPMKGSAGRPRQPLPEAEAAKFDDPDGAGRQALADSVLHDVRAKMVADDPAWRDRTVMLEEGEKPVAVAGALADLDERASLIDVIRGCL